MAGISRVRTLELLAGGPIGVAEWNRIRKEGGSGFTLPDLSGVDLRGADLKGVALGQARLLGADLTGANLERAELNASDLRGAILARARLVGAYLGGSQLRDADLRDADFEGTDLRRAELGGADLRGAKLQQLAVGARTKYRPRYDVNTLFSPGFSPEEQGMELVDPVDDAPGPDDAFDIYFDVDVSPQTAALFIQSLSRMLGDDLEILSVQPGPPWPGARLRLARKAA